ncbi:hypothetical protein Ancab_019646, partial [Ancistrocladus abbreviatus]
PTTVPFPSRRSWLFAGQLILRVGPHQSHPDKKEFSLLINPSHLKPKPLRSPIPSSEMRTPKSKNRRFRKQRRVLDVQEIELLKKWMEFGKPDRGSNPLSLPPLPRDSKIGRIDANTFSRYAGCEFFSQLPLSKKTKDGLRQAEYIKMTEIQRASLPHSLCGRDILGASKTGSG